MTSAKARYLDASALVKLLVDEGDCAPLRAFCNNHPSCNTTLLCVAEALGVLKRKWLKEQLSLEEYVRATTQLLAEARHRIYPDELNPSEHEVNSGVKALVEKYASLKLDVSDALQLYTLRHGPFRFLCGDSTSVLITADENLAKAARDEGLRVWDCIREPAPAWA
jgi:predicted nucleic acid-binding protein